MRFPMSYLAAVATGLLLWASFPPVRFGPMIWWALIPLLAVLWPMRPAPPKAGAGAATPQARPAWWHPTRAPGAFLHGYLAGATFFVLNLSWLRHVTGFSVLLSLFLALYPALWALFAATVGRPQRGNSDWELARAVVVTAAAWTGLEWLRGIVLTGFGWNGLGVALRSSSALSDGDLPLPIAQWAEWIGVTGLSFFVTAQAAYLVGLWRMDCQSDAVGRTRRLSITLAKALVANMIVSAGLVAIAEARAKSVAAAMESPPSLTVALIQPNIPQENKNLFESFEPTAVALATLTQAAFDTQPAPNILVWPESSLPAPYFDETVQDVLRQGLTLGDFTHVLGTDDQELDAYYNSIAVFRGDPLQATLHRKVHLVPFGEYLPARGLFGRFDFIREQLPGDFKAGDSTEPVPLPGPTPRDATTATDPAVNAPAVRKNEAARDFTLIPLVCFEDTLGRVARRFVRSEPQLIVNVTNDAWFQDSAAADQHLANASFRAIELRRPMIRAANTGVTAIVDPLGRITHQLPRLQPGQLKATIPRPTLAIRTLYARIGDAFSITMLAVALIAAGHSLRGGPSPTPPPA